MHSHQSYPNLTTVIHSYVTTVIHSYESIVLLSILVPSRHTRIEAWVNSTLLVCVFFPFILDINGRTRRGHTRGRSHRIFHPPSFCGACLNFSREKDSAIPFLRTGILTHTMPNTWRAANLSWVHKIRPQRRRGKGGLNPFRDKN